MRRLGSRSSEDSSPRIISQQICRHAANRELAIERLAELVRDAVKQVPIRKKTRVSMEAKLMRLEEKKQRGLLKSRRSGRVPDQD